MADVPRILNSEPRSAMLSAVTEILGLKVSKSSGAGGVKLNDLQDKFYAKLEVAYNFESTIIKNMPRLCNHYTALKEEEDKKLCVTTEDQITSWVHEEIVHSWENRFNLFFRVFMHYKNAKTQSIGDKKLALITALLSLDDVELWQKQNDKVKIYTVNQLTSWYNENIDPLSVILVKPEIVGEIE